MMKVCAILLYVLILEANTLFLKNSLLKSNRLSDKIIALYEYIGGRIRCLY